MRAHEFHEVLGRWPSSPEHALTRERDALVAEGHFGEAPTLVHLTQQTDSRQTNLVEEDLVKGVITRHVNDWSNGNARRLHRTDEVRDAVLRRALVGRTREQNPPR